MEKDEVSSGFPGSGALQKLIKLQHNMWKRTSKCQSDSSLVFSVNEGGSMIKRKSPGSHVLENRKLNAQALRENGV
jgi:hypothetical protein